MKVQNGSTSDGIGAVSFRDYRNAVEGQVQAGCTLREIEDFIEACAIDEEQKSVLWLWAWLHQPPHVLHAFADGEALRFMQPESTR